MDKPLHVRVAEALGWTHIEEAPRKDKERSEAEGRFVAAGSDWFGSAPESCHIWGALVRLNGGQDGPASYAVPRYDTDWAATGPLIERCRINLAPKATGEWASAEFHWIATDQYGYARGEGETALEAACLYILALASTPAGKLIL